MFTHRSLFASRSVLLTASLLAAGLACAADFPAGVYGMSGVEATFTKGQYHVREKGTLQVSGRYRAQGDQITLTDKDGPWACKTAGQESGTYRWQLDGSTLTLTKVDDACPDRVKTLDKATLQKLR